MAPTLPLLLAASLQPDGLLVRLHNPGDRALRVWSPGNVWGDAAWSVQLAAVGADAARVLRAGKQPYTANLPLCIELQAQGDASVRLAPGTPAWTFGEDLSALQSLPLRVRVVLEIAPSPDTTTHGVSTGRAESDALLSQPPHRWLLPGLS